MIWEKEFWITMIDGNAPSKANGASVMADSDLLFDPHIQESAPQRTILHFLRSLAPTYQKLTPKTHEEEQALGVLLLAKGVQILDEEESATPSYNPDTARSCYVRLTSSGVNWQAYLAEYESADAVKVRGAVLGFVLDAYRRNPDARHQEAIAPAPTTPEESVSAHETPGALKDTSQTARAESKTDEDPAAEQRRFIHKPWPGSDSWHNWGVGVDDEGRWHLFHFWRSGDASAIYQWKHHRHARVKIAAGQMDAIARRFVEQQSLPVSGDDEIERIKPVISRLRKVLGAAVLAEGHKPEGSPIQSPTADRPAYLAAIKFGKVVNKNRHTCLDCTY